MKTFITILLVIIVVAGLGYYLMREKGTSSLPPIENIPTTSSSTNPTPTSSGSSTSTTATTSMTNLIKVTSPAANTIIKSPVTVTGQARGTWYFEASFPIKIKDANGQVLGSIPAQAQGEWMTTEFVPFKASVSFASSTTATGFIVLEKDNPSGLPQNAAEVLIPIRFR